MWEKRNRLAHWFAEISGSPDDCFLRDHYYFYLSGNSVLPLIQSTVEQTLVFSRCVFGSHNIPFVGKGAGLVAIKERCFTNWWTPWTLEDPGIQIAARMESYFSQKKSNQLHHAHIANLARMCSVGGKYFSNSCNSIDWGMAPLKGHRFHSVLRHRIDDKDGSDSSASSFSVYRLHLDPATLLCEDCLKIATRLLWWTRSFSNLFTLCWKTVAVTHRTIWKPRLADYAWSSLVATGSWFQSSQFASDSKTNMIASAR